MSPAGVDTMETNASSLRAGFAETDITPPIGTRKIGVLTKLVAESVLDPLHARVAVIENAAERVAFVQLDTLCVRWSRVAHSRRRVTEEYGFPGANVMVTATHNHAGPAVANLGDVERDDSYVDALVSKVVATFGQALANRQEVEIGFGRCFEFDAAYNRRVVLRDGTVRTHGSFDDPEGLFLEGPIDPELSVLAVRGKNGGPLGVLVNFACHVGHHGSTTEFSAGFPGALNREMRSRGCPMTLFLNGACGNVAYGDPFRGGVAKAKEEIGAILAADAQAILEGIDYRTEAVLSARSQTIDLPYRQYTEDDIRGTARGSQRGGSDPSVYDRCMPALAQRIRERRTQPAEVQVLSIDEHAFVALPAEYFAELGLKIKELAWPRRALVVSCANGMVGYAPTREAFERGGYETTFGPTSHLTPEAGGRLAEAAIGLITWRPDR